MQSGQILPEDPKKKNQSGQTLVEFALLLLVIATISFGFIAVTNRNLAKYWTAYARLIVDDPSQDGIINL